MKALCFTGHRPEKLPWGADERAESCLGFLARLREELRKAVANGYTTFLTGMAEGIDLIAAREVLALRESNPEIRLIAVLPYPRRGNASFYAVKNAADEVVLLSREYYTGCLFQRNRYLVDHSDAVLAVYAGGGGGTKQTIEYARSVGKPVKVLRP